MNTEEARKDYLDRKYKRTRWIKACNKCTHTTPHGFSYLKCKIIDKVVSGKILKAFTCRYYKEKKRI